ncbi:hypothetical protein ZWY2020_000309 [Hordeum vulgare]|nr:hypothetical protein ZWY2020_000309 [Hordeum vulgare]
MAILRKSLWVNPHSRCPSLPLFKLLEPGCATYSLALPHPRRRLLRFRARLPFSRTIGVLTSDGARIAADDSATGESPLALFHTLTAASSASAPASPSVGVLTSKGATDDILLHRPKAEAKRRQELIHHWTPAMH